jgi:hypothetical protein
MTPQIVKDSSHGCDCPRGHGPAGTAEAYGGGFGGGGLHAGAFTGAVSGGEVFAVAAFVATGFGLVGFLEGFTPVLWRLLPQLLRIRLLLSDRTRDHVLLPITTGRLGASRSRFSPRSPGLLPELLGVQPRTRP